MWVLKNEFIDDEINFMLNWYVPHETLYVIGLCGLYYNIHVYF